MWNLKYDKLTYLQNRNKLTDKINLSTKQKQTHRHREQNCGCQGGGSVGEGGLGVWDQQMQIIIYRMDKQQGPTVQHRELYSVSCNKP